MIRVTVSLLVAGALLAGSASAEPDPTPTVAPVGEPPAAVEAPAAKAPPKSPAPGNVVSGVTVPARPAKCSDRDKACIEAVVAQLWQLYPKELKNWCRDQNAAALRQNVLNGEVMGTGTHPVIGGLSAPPDVTRVACFKPKAPAKATPSPGGL